MDEAANAIATTVFDQGNYVSYLSMFSLSSTRSLLAACRPSKSFVSHVAAAPTPLLTFARFRSQLAPKRVKYIKRQKGVVPIPVGGSIKGTTLAYGDWGIRIKENGKRLTAKQLTAAEEVIKRKIKPIKGAKVYMRVFPDIPVCIKVGSVNPVLLNTALKRHTYIG